MRGTRRWSLRATLLLVAGWVAAASSGTLSGVVINGQTGQPVPAASLELLGTDAGSAADTAGLFRLQVVAGRYSVRVTAEGFEPATMDDVEVREGDLTDLAVVLMPLAGGGSSAPEAEAGAAGEPGAQPRQTFTDTVSVTAEAERATAEALLANREHAAQPVVGHHHQRPGLRHPLEIESADLAAHAQGGEPLPAACSLDQQPATAWQQALSAPQRGRAPR